MQNIENGSKIRENIVRILFALMMIIAAVYFAAGEWVLPSERNSEAYQSREFVAKWERIYPDGTRLPIEIPGEYEADPDGRIIIETVLPKIGSHEYMMFWSQRQDVNIYVGTELREYYTTKDTRAFGNSSPALYVFARLEPRDTGKVLRIETSGVPGYVGTGILRQIQIGERMGIWVNLLKENIAEVASAIIVLLFGIACVVFGTVIRLSYRKQSHLEYLGWGVMVSSLWIITNSNLRQILFRNVSVANDLAFMMVMIMPMPFLIYVNRVQSRRYQVAYGVIESVVTLNFTVCLGLQVSGLYDFPESFPMIASVCVAAIVYVVVTMLIDVVKKRIREYRLLAIGFLGVGAAAVAQIYMYVSKMETPFNGSLIAAGLLFLVIISLIDTIREILRSEEEKRKAIYASESKARFLAQMSHEIRTPINAILGMNEIIINESSEDTIVSYAQDVQGAGATLLSLVNEILDFSKIESGKMELVPAEYEVASLLIDTYQMIAMRAQNKGLDLAFHCDKNMPRRLFGDAGRIMQILINLLTNAVKYTNEGRVTLNMDWQPLEKGKLVLKVAVSDTGIGIREESQARLFDSFERIDVKKNRHIEGTGLGLSITKSLVDLMGGNISVQSIYGKGSTFCVVLPQIIISDEPVGEQHFGKVEREAVLQEEQTEKRLLDAELDFKAPDVHVLVVDDVPMNLRVFQGLLKSTEMQIDIASSGKECLQRIQEKVYELIFLDHMMPEMDGIEVLQHMRGMESNINHDTPVIMLTANAITGAKEEYLQAGFSEYLSKPIDNQKLRRLILRYLAAQSVAVTQETEGMEKVQKSFVERIAFLNVKSGMLYSGGSEALYEEIVGMFAKDDKQALLQQLFEAEDWKNYQIHVHGLKGISLSIGADDFSLLAKSVEQAAKNNMLEFVKSHHAELMSEYAALLERLKEALK